MYPNPIKVPDFVPGAREERQRQVVQATKFGIAIRCGIILFELLGVIIYNSSAIWMDVVGTLFDVTGSLFLLFCMKLASQPPDEDHPMGHGRFEPLGGLQLGVLLVLIGLGSLIYNSVMLFHQHDFEQISPHAWIFPFIAMILLEISYHVISRTAKKQHSPALAADAVHYRIDAITSLLATVALLAAASYPQWSHHFDYLGAIVISIVMVIIGFIASKENLHQLTDKIPENKYFELIRRSARQVDGVMGTEKIKVQIYGPDAHVDIDIEVDPQMSVDAAHRVSQEVRVEIQKSWPSVRDVTVHIEPYYPDDH